jgi:hypothetical protein
MCEPDLDDQMREVLAVLDPVFSKGPDRARTLEIRAIRVRLDARSTGPEVDRGPGNSTPLRGVYAGQGPF